MAKKSVIFKAFCKPNVRFDSIKNRKSSTGNRQFLRSFEATGRALNTRVIGHLWKRIENAMPFCWPRIQTQNSSDFKFESKRIKAPKIFHILLVKIATLIDGFIEKFYLQGQMSTFANKIV